MTYNVLKDELHKFGFIAQLFNCRDDREFEIIARVIRRVNLSLNHGQLSENRLSVFFPRG